MYRKDSENSSQSGLTLLEIMVALVVGGIMLAGLTYFYKNSYKTYNLQEQISERNQNAQYALGKISEILQQVGSVLPDTGWTVITTIGSSPITGFVVGYNPRGGALSVTEKQTSATKILIGDVSGFKAATQVLLDYAGNTAPALKTIDISANSGGFVSGLKDCPTATNCNGGTQDSLALTSAVTLDTSDLVYAYKVDTVKLVGTDLTVGGNVMAENVDSLSFVFYDKTGTATTTWKNMRSAFVFVRARTASRDPNIATNGGYRTISMNANVLFRSRL